MSEHTLLGSWDEVHGEIESSSKFVISSHINPDGDAIGSALAMRRILERLGKDAYCVMDKYPGRSFDPFYKNGEIRIFEGNQLDFSDRDTVMITDAGFYKRLGEVGNVLEQHPGRKICIDHHPPYKEFTGVRHVDTASPSTTVMVYRYVKFLEMELTQEIAEPIYLGLIVDTQNFHLPNTTIEAHEIAADCLKAGVHPTKVYEPVFGTNRFSRLRLMSDAFHTMQVLCGGKVAVMHTSRSMFDDAKAELGEDEGFSDLVRTIDGVDIGIYLREEPEGKVKASWRAKGDHNVEISARKFGGGGHVRAAGALIKGTLDEVRNKVVEDMEERVAKGEV